MKTSYFSWLILLALITSLAAAPESKETGADSGQELQANIKKFKSPKISDRFQKIIYQNEYAFIPKGCIVFLPEKHQSKISFISGKAVPISWQQFQSKHKSFIHTVPLSKSQAQGSKASKQYIMPYKQFEGLKKLGRVIICTYNNTPVRIKVHPKPQKK